MLPLILLIGGMKVNTEAIISAWREITYQLSVPQAADFTYLKSFFTRYLPGKQPVDYSLEIVPQQAGRVERNGLIELNLETDIPFSNPYDSTGIDLKVMFITPSGRRLAAGAFWYQAFDPQTRREDGKPGWKVRFTPDESGEWTAYAFAPALNVESQPYHFTVVQSERSGFVHIDRSNPRYLATDDGNIFFPIGVNMAWWEDGADPLEQYRQWLEQFSKNGGNTIRVWMAAWSFGIEWKDSGLGNYDSRQYEAWLLDGLFQLADEYHIKIILVLMNHGQLSLTANSEWKDNPYNRSLGGPLDKPEQFVSNPEAMVYYQQRLSYIINRWSYSPELLAWEWFNEVDLTPITDRALLPWLTEMTAYLHVRDIYHHLTTNSFSVRTWSDAWHLSGLEIVQVHEYADKLDPGERDPISIVTNQYQTIAQHLPGKPILVGEFGYSSKERGERIEKTGIQLHNGIWATTFSGYAGSGMYWWWDTYIAANDLWYHFKGLADFIKGEDLKQYAPDPGIEVLDKHGTTTQVTGMELRGEVRLVWLRGEDYTVEAAAAVRNKTTGTSTYSPPLKEGLFLSLTDVQTGEYSVYWYDPQTAEWLDKETVSSDGNRLNIPIPPFCDDLAAKIVLNH